MRDVAHRLGDELRIGHDDRGAVSHLDFGGAYVDAQDVALDAAQRDPVAHFHRPLRQQDQARNEILHHRLQAETDAHRQRAGDPRHAFQPQAERGQAQRGGGHHAGIAEQRGRGNLHARIEFGGRQVAGGQPALEQPHDQQAERQDQQGLQQRGGPDLHLADLQPLVHLVQTVHQVHRALAEGRQQQHHRGQHDRHAASPRQQHRRLRAQAQLGAGIAVAVRAQQGAETVVDQHDQQIGRAQHDQRPHGLLDEECAECGIADDQREQAGTEHRPQRGVEHRQPEWPRRGAIVLAFQRKLAAHALGAGQRRQQHQSQHGGHHHAQRDRAGQAGVQQHRQALGQPDRHHQQAQRRRHPAQGARNLVGNRR
ncbi:Uncharacterised protein [Bordetella pertussis]|nr:Uncharacterised protein [Bordetella pertussis]CPO44845.1 Uncharacterised protein [Bordetella pertussis]